MGKVRRPAVAGSFYEGNKKRLEEQISESFLHSLGPGSLPQLNKEGEGKIVGLVSPHAGFVYSGPVAAHNFYQLAKDGRKDLIIILGPNHRGAGKEVAIMTSGAWQTPLGEVRIDEKMAEKIAEAEKFIEVDERAHQLEHSLEVQLPFLQYIFKEEFSFVPICMLDQSLEVSIKVGEALGKVLAKENSLIIASSDFTHYEPQSAAERKDKEAIDSILKMDPEELLKRVSRLNISMCGPGPVAAMLTAAKILGGKSARLLKYATSGDVTGSYSQVVGYAALEIRR